MPITCPTNSSTSRLIESCSLALPVTRKDEVKSVIWDVDPATSLAICMN